MYYSQWLVIFPGLVLGMTTATILAIGCWQIMQSYSTVGTLVAFQGILASLYTPINTLIQFNESIQQIRGDFDRLSDVLKQPIDIRHDGETQAAPTEHTDQAKTAAKPLRLTLTLKDVSFGYSRLESPLIAGCTITLTPGKQLAIIGKTGSGKSTLSKLITGLYQPWSGEILLGDKPLLSYAPETLSKTIAMVDQDICLFPGTLLENLTLSNTSITDTDLEKALSDACLESLLLERGGLDALVEEGGKNFSGGQRQQLEIARALATNPSILVLDEATASLDTLTEKAVFENIKKRDCSLVIIAHRLSTIRDSDEIITMDNGKIIKKEAGK